MRNSPYFIYPAVLLVIQAFISLILLCSCNKSPISNIPETEKPEETLTGQTETSESETVLNITPNTDTSDTASESSQSDTINTDPPDDTSNKNEPDSTGGTTSASRHSFIRLDITSDMLAIPVAEKPAVNMDYFSDSVIVGNSLAEGLYLYSGIKGAVPYIEKGIVVKDCFDKKIINIDGEYYTVIEALRLNNNFSKVYLTFGLNEMGYSYLSEFVRQYGNLISEIKNICPNAIIYVQSCLPVTSETSKNDRVFFNENIEVMNETLRYIAKSNNVNYIDVASVMKSADGTLPNDWASYDGIHLTPKAYKVWFEYLMTHTV